MSEENCSLLLFAAALYSGVVMDIFPRTISVHYIRIHFGYMPGTHILNAL